MTFDESIDAILAGQREILLELAALRRVREEAKKPKRHEWMTAKEAAVALHVSVPTVRNFVKRKILPRNAASRHILIPAESVEKIDRKVIV